jgi:hypothetical protein
VAEQTVDRFAGQDVHVCVDVEADGPIPLVHSLSSLGACLAGSFDGQRFTRLDPAADTFYAELAPVSEEFVPEALAVSGLDRDRLHREGEDPRAAMTRFAAWVQQVCGAGRPVLVAYPASYDWPWVSVYLARFSEQGSPFGFSGVLDMKTMYAVKAGVRIGKATKRSMPKALLSQRPHTHHALDDALEQADLFANLMLWPGPGSR